MKILLIGEYSRLHNSLKEGLTFLGHEVAICGFADGFKDFPVDFKLEKRWKTGILKKLKVGIYKLSGFNVTSYLTYKQFNKNKDRFSGYDVVQLISENSFFCEPWIEKKMLEHLFDNNKKVFLLSCGDDFSSISYYFKHPEEKSVIQPYLMGKIRRKKFMNVLKFRSKAYRDLHKFISERISGIIASDLDYHIPLKNHPKYLGMIPNPINVDKIAFHPMQINGKVKIFLGINGESYYKKGIDYFEKALEQITSKFGKRAEAVRSFNRPYAEYITLYEDSHIMLDQAYARDQGYNALEAMAKGKVVFTGAEEIFDRHYQLSNKVAVNAVPDVETLVTDLSHYIENPDDIVQMGIRAREFVEKEHHYVKIASKYIETWSQA